jgi:hypothetical protein
MAGQYQDRQDSKIYGSRLIIHRRVDLDNDNFYFRAKVSGHTGYIRRSCQTDDPARAMLLVMDGADGDDTIASKAGDDSISAGAGNDRIAASDGNDTIAGGDHNDVMTGGNGADVFKFRVFNTNTEDRITDFTRGEDLLEMRWSFAGLNIRSHADGIQIEKNGHVIIIEDVADLSADDFNFV